MRGGTWNLLYWCRKIAFCCGLHSLQTGLELHPCQSFGPTINIETRTFLPLHFQYKDSWIFTILLLTENKKKNQRFFVDDFEREKIYYMYLKCIYSVNTFKRFIHLNFFLCRKSRMSKISFPMVNNSKTRIRWWVSIKYCGACKVHMLCTSI